MSEKPKKKSGSIAIPFLITIFVGLLLIGGTAFGIYKHLNSKKDDKPKEPTPRNGITSATPEDSHTILLILNDPEGQKASATFVLMRSIPYKKQLLFIGIPSNSIFYSEKEGAQVALKDTFERNGAKSAVSFVEDVLNIKVDKYMSFDPDAFLRVCDIFGGVTYPVDINFTGFTDDSSLQTMGPDDIRKYLTYNNFKGGEAERSFKAASVLSYMVNGSDGDRIAGNFDRYFSEIINKLGVAGTDISGSDYDKRKNAIKYMFNYGQSIAIAITIDGENAGIDFIPDSNFVNNIPEDYFKDAKVK